MVARSTDRASGRACAIPHGSLTCAVAAQASALQPACRLPRWRASMPRLRTPHRPARHSPWRAARQFPPAPAPGSAMPRSSPSAADDKHISAPDVHIVKRRDCSLPASAVQLTHGTDIRKASTARGQRSAQPVQNRCLDEKRLHCRRLLLQQLAGKVVCDLAVIGVAAGRRSGWLPGHAGKWPPGGDRRSSLRLLLPKLQPWHR